MNSDDERERVLGAVLNSIAPGRVTRRDPDQGTLLTRGFRAVAEGRRVRVDDSEPSPYGVPGLYPQDVAVILGENTTRRHDDLVQATVVEKIAALTMAVIDTVRGQSPVEKRTGEGVLSVVKNILELRDLYLSSIAAAKIRKKAKAKKAKKRNRTK